MTKKKIATTPTTSVSDLIEMVISFDTTGSMYPCLSEVRRRVTETAKRLFDSIPNLRLAIVAHGDYCDRDIYVTKHLKFTSDFNAVSYFINHVEPTCGGDAPECYELVLKEVSELAWTPGSKRVLTLIGDCEPHPKAHNPGKIDWKEEAKKLLDMGVVINAVQALGRSYADFFYSGLASITGGYHIRLNQFCETSEMLIAIAYQQQGPEALKAYEEELVTSSKMTRSMSSIFDSLSRRDPSTGRFRKIDTRAVPAGKFQRIPVTTDYVIKDLVEANGLAFKKGRGFYEFTKTETIQAAKEIVILDKISGDMYQGDAGREVLGLPIGASTRLAPTYDRSHYSVFVQSTSNNRKLKANTTFLYESE